MKLTWNSFPLGANEIVTTMAGDAEGLRALGETLIAASEYRGPCAALLEGPGHRFHIIAYCTEEKPPPPANGNGKLLPN
jgi:hypothetical protein